MLFKCSQPHYEVNISLQFADEEMETYSCYITLPRSTSDVMVLTLSGMCPQPLKYAATQPFI